MKKHFFYLLSLIAALSVSACCSEPSGKIAALVPQPNHVKTLCGNCAVAGMPISCESQLDARTLNAVNDFAAQLSQASGVVSVVTVCEAVPSEGMRFLADASLAEEAYKLTIKQNGVEVRASSFAGFFYALQTIKQLLPAAVYGDETVADADWTLPCAVIDDAPRFAYRGMHFDVSRHFFSLDEVKRYIDVMAVHKLNRLHWHLTDDQGWRIEIKKYPRLTSVSAYRDGTMILKNWGSNDGVRHGGYYTQDEIREIVAYAADRAITVIPEVDLPGHMVAVLAAYPELGCTGGPYKVWDRWGVSEDVLCAGNEKTFEFLENVLTEVMELFPSEYIHIGGDESPKDRWKCCPRCQARIKELGLKDGEKFSAEQYLQCYVTSRMEDFLKAHGRRIIGWDEILEGEISKSAVVMSWRGSEGGIEAAKRGNDVIMTPNSHFYFDYYQSLDEDNEPFGIGGYIPVERVYSYDPMDGLTPDEQKHIMGVQANLWTEYISDDAHLEYMLLPRMAALSEVQWCQPEVRDEKRFYDNFRMQEVYDVMGYNYAKHIFYVSGVTRVDGSKGCVTVELSTSGKAPIRYTLDGSEPTPESPLYTAPVEIRNSCVLKAASFREGMQVPVYERVFEVGKATGHVVTLNSNPTPKYHYNAPHAFTDGHHGGTGFSDTEWVGYLAEPMDITVDMKGAGSYSSVTVESLVDKVNWIFPPKDITVRLSDDGKEFVEAAVLQVPEENGETPDGIKNYTVTFPESNARYVRIVAETVNPIPAWHGAAGEPSHMFIGEISVE